MIPINSTLKIVGAGDARRHLETGFRLTHIPPHTLPSAANKRSNLSVHSANCFPPTVVPTAQIYICHVYLHGPIIRQFHRQFLREHYPEGIISSSFSREGILLERGYRSIARYFTRDEFNDSHSTIAFHSQRNRFFDCCHSIQRIQRRTRIFFFLSWLVWLIAGSEVIFLFRVYWIVLNVIIGESGCL